MVAGAVRLRTTLQCPDGPARIKLKPIHMKVIQYSDKAIAVIGNTKPYREELKAIGGKFNPYLKCGVGWIFSAKRRAELDAFVSGTNGDSFDMAIEDRMAESAGVGNFLSHYERGNY